MDWEEVYEHREAAFESIFPCKLWNQDRHFLENFLMFRPAFGKQCDVDPRNQKVTGILAEASGSMSEVRPVCAIYYSDPFLTGDGRVVHKEFMANWVHLY